MEIQLLKKYESRKVRIILKNSFVFSSIIFKITDEGLLRFRDKNGAEIILEPSFIALISPIDEAKKMENEKGNR